MTIPNDPTRSAAPYGATPVYLVGGAEGGPFSIVIGAGLGIAANVAGDVAAGATDSGFPVKAGGVASSTTPTAVTTGQRQNNWLTLPGRQVVCAISGTTAGDGTVTPANVQLTPAEATAIPAVYPFLFNGTGKDFTRGNVDATLLASAARTATTASADQTNYNGDGVIVVLNVTVASGTGGLQLQIQGKDPVSGTYYNLNVAPAAITATGIYAYALWPALGTIPGAGSSVVQHTGTLLPRVWRVSVTHGDASGYTYSVGSSNVMG